MLTRAEIISLRAYPVDNGIVNDITGETGFNNFTYSATSYITDTNPTTEPTTEPTQPTQPTTEPTDPTQPTTPPTDQLTVNAKSNFFTNTTKTFDKNTDTVTVYYKPQLIKSYGQSSLDSHL